VQNKENEYIVWLKSTAFDFLVSEATKWMPKETGGVIIGYWGSPKEVVVTEIIGPGPRAIHKTSSFKPDNKFHEKEILRVYQASERTETYIGDWHTHPNSNAYLSEQDKITLKRISAYKQARLKKPLMMILGTDPIELCAWVQKTRNNSRSQNEVDFTKCNTRLFSVY
jgi:integrative and conjugative element protein (TIGR02256 family)